MQWRFLFVLPLLIISVINAHSQEQPISFHITGKDAADMANVIINEVNADQYPKVRIFATVLKNDTPLKGLSASDFRVREDEVEQEPLTVEPKLPPLSVVITLDSSGSMSNCMQQAQAAAMSFLDTLGDQDSTQVVSFARQVKRLTCMDSNREIARHAIETTVARGNTALYEALYESITLLKDRSGRKAIVLLSDGMDDDGTGKPLSKHTLKDVIGLAREVNVPIYVLGLGNEIDEAALSQTANETGALYYEAPTAKDLKTLYAKIGAQLAGQYAIHYTSSLPADGTSHQITLTARDTTDTKAYLTPGTLHAINQPEAIKVFSNVPRQGSENFKTNTRPDLNIQTTRWDKVPYHVAPPFRHVFNLAPGQRVMLSGNETGNAGFSIDNFLLIEVSETNEPTRFLLGVTDPVSCAGALVNQVAGGFDFGSPGFDLTPYLPTGVSFKLSISALDYGAAGYVSDVYLIITSEH